jgi:branched-chain amino acid transport system substrate-binding protein
VAPEREGERRGCALDPIRRRGAWSPPRFVMPARLDAGRASILTGGIMKHRSLLAAALALPMAITATLGVCAAEPYEIHAILPLTGGGAFIGTAMKSNLEALETVVNKDGGINGRPVHFVVHDDETNPQRAVERANEVIATKPAIVLGSAIVAMCNAMAPLMKNGPVLYCLSPSYSPVANGFVESAGTSTPDQLDALIRYYRLKGYTKIALLNGIDATGQNADKAIDKIMADPDNKGVSIVERQHFAPTDISVSAQIERIKGAGAQALIAWTTGAQVATIFKGMVQAGLDIPVGVSSGNQIFAQMEEYRAFAPKQLVLPTALFAEHEGVLTLDPRMEKAQHAMYDALQAKKLKADIATSLTWDAGLLAVAALKSAGEGAKPEDVRKYLADLSDFPGINGIYDFKKVPGRGLGRDSATIVRYDPEAKRWQWLAKQGGTPLN